MTVRHGQVQTAQMDLIATGQTTPEEAVEGFKEEMKNIYPEIEID